MSISYPIARSRLGLICQIYANSSACQYFAAIIYANYNPQRIRRSCAADVTCRLLRMENVLRVCSRSAVLQTFFYMLIFLQWVYENFGIFNCDFLHDCNADFLLDCNFNLEIWVFIFCIWMDFIRLFRERKAAAPVPFRDRANSSNHFNSQFCRNLYRQFA